MVQQRLSGRGGRRAAEAVQMAEAGLTPEQRELVVWHIGLVRAHLRTRVPTPDFPHRDREYDDLFQEGCLGLVRAARRYTQLRPAMCFASYAIPRIRRAVYSAIFEAFATVRLPRDFCEFHPAVAMQGSDVLEKIEELGGARRLDGEATCSGLKTESSAGARDEALPTELWHAVRGRFEAAVADALGELRRRRWRKRNPLAIMKRMAYERLLISEECGRTALRQIARDAGVSSSRAAAYESKLQAAVAERLRRDEELARLLKVSRAAGASPERERGGRR